MKDKPTLFTGRPANRPVLDYLKEKSGGRHSKLEAYCDLLDKASAGYVSDALKKAGVELQPGQLAVTITDLAGCWHWHRATVRSFLIGLEDLGQIERSALTRSYVITMAETVPVGNEAGQGKGKAGDPLADRLDAILSEWTFGRLSDAECGQACGHLAGAETKSRFGQIQDGSPDNLPAVRSEKRRTAMERMAFASVRRALHKYRIGDTDPLECFFRDELGGDWTLFPEAMKTLAELVIDGESESLELESAAAKDMFMALREPFKAVLACGWEQEDGN